MAKSNFMPIEELEDGADVGHQIFRRHCGHLKLIGQIWPQNHCFSITMANGIKPVRWAPGRRWPGDDFGAKSWIGQCPGRRWIGPPGRDLQRENQNFDQNQNNQNIPSEQRGPKKADTLEPNSRFMAWEEPLSLSAPSGHFWLSISEDFTLKMPKNHKLIWSGKPWILKMDRMVGFTNLISGPNNMIGPTGLAVRKPIKID